MYVILTSKPGQFRTEPDPALQPIESYDYMFCGRKRAHFVIASLESAIKVTIVEEGENPATNLVPSKFLPSFDSLERARAELKQLASFGSMQASLVRC
jgi:hypothetical protein